MVEIDPYVSLVLLLIFTFAFIVPIIFSRVKKVFIPVFVVDIVIGLILGQSGFKLIPTLDSQPWLEFLYFFGFAFLMLLSGMEVDFKEFSSYEKEQVNQNRPSEDGDYIDEVYLKEKWYFLHRHINRRPLLMGTLIYLFTLGLSLAFFYLLSFYFPMPSYIYTAVLFSTTSLGIVFPILVELKLIKEGYGQRILIASFVADFISIILVTSIIGIYSSGFSLLLLLMPLMFLVFFIVFQVLKIFKKRKWHAKIFTESASVYEVRTTGALLLLFFFIFLTAVFGTEMILGAFLAGTLISIFGPEDKTHILYNKLHAIGYGFVIPVFFIMVGAQLKLEGSSLLSDIIILVLIIFLICLIIKIVPNLLFFKLGKFGFKKSFTAGLLQTAQLSLIVAAAEIGKKIGIITPLLYECAIFIVIITCIISPIISARLLHERNLKIEQENLLDKKL